MKKIIILIVAIMLVGCSKKADIVCTETNEIFTTNVELYFEDNKLIDAVSISEYKSETLVEQICSNLGEKVKCYKNKIEITNYLDNLKGEGKTNVIKQLEAQGLSCSR